jgi:heptosyltransferase-2
LIVLAPNWLGDAVMALPLLADLRRAWPATAIVIAARPAVAGLFALIPAVQTVPLRGGGGLKALFGWQSDASALRRAEGDAALLLPNSFASAWIVSRAGIPERWGYATDGRSRFLTQALARPAARVHQAQYYSELGTRLGIQTGPLHASVPVGEHARATAQQLLEQHGLPADQSFVVMAPGAAYGRAKQWLPERFAELAVMIANERSLATVLVGSAADAPVCREIVGLAKHTEGIHAVIDLSGKTTLEALTGVLSLSAATVANDSGAMHLAAAVGAKVLAVFGPTDDRRTSPLRAGATAPEPVILHHDVWCRPCMLRECPIDHRCMRGVTARAVLDAL